MVEQSVDHRAGRMTRAGVYHHAGRFVQDGNVGILIEDVERQCLARRGEGAPREGDADAVALADDQIRFCLVRPCAARSMSLNVDVTIRNQALNLRT